MLGRDKRDYTIEHADYMADAAIYYMTAVDAMETYALSVEEGEEEYDEDADQQSRESVSDHRKILESAIYEYRKRRDKQKQSNAGESFLEAKRPGVNPFPPPYTKPNPPPGPPKKRCI